jgi:hypothetical protein
MSAPTMLVVCCPSRTVALVEAQLEPSQADFDRYVLSPETITAVGMAAESEAAIASVVLEQRLAEVSQRFREKFPALTRWRDAIIERPRRYRPSEVAAAFEALALELTWAGEQELAARAQHRAIRAVLPNGVGAPAEDERSA